MVIPRLGGAPRSLRGQSLLARGSGSSSRQQTATALVRWILLAFVLMVALVYAVFAWRVMLLSSPAHHPHQQQQQQQAETFQQQQREQRARERDNSKKCSFRTYPDHRFYKLHAPSQPDFLTGTNTEYIYGAWPALLPTTTSIAAGLPNSRAAHKLCVDQSPWLKQRSLSSSSMNATTTTTTTTLLPFADGTNPSILSVQRYVQNVRSPFSSLLGASRNNNNNNVQNNNNNNNNKNKNIHWMATVCMTNSQCHWKDSPAQMKFLRMSMQDQPDTVRTVLLLLSDQFETIHQATIFLKLDAPYGKVGARNQLKPSSEPYMPALDDARLFVHNGQLWISYREGKLFGYDAQVLNPVHLEWSDNDNNNNNNNINNGGTGGSSGTFQVTLLASETAFFCCGRNMALMQNLRRPESLLSLTWVDPITVISVDTTPLRRLLQQQSSSSSWKQKQQQQQQQQGRKLMEEVHSREMPLDHAHDDTTTTLGLLSDVILDRSAFVVSSSSLSSSSSSSSPGQKRHPRRLADVSKNSKKKSHIHGTNAFMLYLEHRNEFLGVAHFHRPNDRSPNDYARFGHHYTHAFYTVSTEEPFVLTSLSAEFVLPAAAATATATTTAGMDAEIIQFVSGLEWDEGNHQIVLAYGINDCEAAIVRIEAHVVDAWLRPVTPPGKQVVDFMQPLTNNAPPQLL